MIKAACIQFPCYNLRNYKISYENFSSTGSRLILASLIIESLQKNKALVINLHHLSLLHSCYLWLPCVCQADITWISWISKLQRKWGYHFAYLEDLSRAIFTIKWKIQVHCQILRKWGDNLLKFRNKNILLNGLQVNVWTQAYR